MNFTTICRGVVVGRPRPLVSLIGFHGDVTTFEPSTWIQVSAAGPGPDPGELTGAVGLSKNRIAVATTNAVRIIDVIRGTIVEQIHWNEHFFRGPFVSSIDSLNDDICVAWMGWFRNDDRRDYLSLYAVDSAQEVARHRLSFLPPKLAADQSGNRILLAHNIQCRFQWFDLDTGNLGENLYADEENSWFNSCQPFVRKNRIAIGIGKEIYIWLDGKTRPSKIHYGTAGGPCQVHLLPDQVVAASDNNVRVYAR